MKILALLALAATVAAQSPANFAKPRVGAVALASQFGQWQATGHGPIGPPGGTVSLTPSTFTLPDATSWVPFTVGTAVMIGDGPLSEAVTVTAVSCASGAAVCSFAASFANQHNGSFTVSSATGGLQEAVNYEATAGGGLVIADPAFTGSVTGLLSALRLPSNVLLIDETGGNFNFYGLGGGGAPSLIAKFSSATGTNLGGGGGSGTVTSAGLSLPGIFSVSGSPITTAGTLSATLASQFANFVWAGPTSGVAAAPAFRALVGGDLPAPSPTTLGGVESAAAVAHQWINSISAAGAPALSQPSFGDLAGMVATSQLPLVPVANGGTGAATLAGANLPVFTGTITTGDCVKWASGTSITDAGSTCGSGGGAGVGSLQADSNTALGGAVQLLSGTGLSSSQNGQQVTLNVNTATSSQAGILALTGDLGGISSSPLVAAVHVGLSNDTTTGTTVNLVVKLVATGAVVTATGDTTGAIGIVTAGAGKTGVAQVATQGVVSCQFDANAVIIGDWVQLSSITAGDCHDAGATRPASGEILGHAVSGGAASTVQSVLLEVSW